MLSLEFLPLQAGDTCRIYPDRQGHYFIVIIRNYLLLCFSDWLAAKYKSRVVVKSRVELVGD